MADLEITSATEAQQAGMRRAFDAAGPANIMDGMARDKVDHTVVLDTGVVYLDLEKIGGGNADFVVFGELVVLDCETGAGVDGKARIALTAGADANTPARNYVYVTDAGGGVAQLNVSTSVPTGAFAWIGYLVIPDATTFATTGAYLHQRYTESPNDSRGQISHERQKIRALGGLYLDGITTTPSPAVDTPTTGAVHLGISSGRVYQLHPQSFPEILTGPYYHGNGSSIYNVETDLTGFTQALDGSTIADGDSYNLVIWGAVNYDAGTCKLFVNKPQIVVRDPEAAKVDREGSARYSVPAEMGQVAFMIARVTMTYSSDAGGTWTITNVASLLGRPAAEVDGNDSPRTAERVIQQQREVVQDIGNTGASKTLSLKNGPVIRATLVGDTTFTMPTPVAGKSFTLELLTGAGSFAPTFTGVRWAGGSAPTITATAAKMDVAAFFSDGTYWYGSIIQDFDPV